MSARVESKDEILIINPPLYSHNGRLSLGQLASVTLVDVAYRYIRRISTDIKYASIAYNSQGKPVETDRDTNVGLIDFIENALAITNLSALHIEAEKAKLGILGTGLEFIDTRDAAHMTVQKRFLDLRKSGYMVRDGRNFFLNTSAIIKSHDINRMLKDVDFHPVSLVNTITQLLSDATTQVALTKDRLFATPLPVYLCKGCDIDFVPKELTLPSDPRIAPHECPNCHTPTINDPRDTIAPLFDLTQQKAFLTENSNARVIQVCGRNVFTNYIFFSLLVNVAIDNRIPFDTLITHGYLNDSSGKRMSRRNDNVVYVDDLLSQYHPDTIRYAILKTITQKDASGNFDINLLKTGQKFIRRIGNLRKFFLSNMIKLDNYQTDFESMDRYQALMDKFEYKHAFSIAEEFLNRISSDIANERNGNGVNINDKAIRYKTAIIMLEPFFPTITDQVTTGLF
jgi:valyl-tRNA synthetase